MKTQHLAELLEKAVQDHPERVALEDEWGGALTYRQLADQADRLAARLARWGVGRGDRVAVWLEKSLESAAAIQGILRAGAAYVPVDPRGPQMRSVGVMAAAGVKAAIVAAPLAGALRQHWPSGPLPRLIVVEGRNQDHPTPAVDAASFAEILADKAPSPLTPERSPDDLAYILYTSGSTGEPKGVMHTHSSAFCFLDWCQAALGPFQPEDRFISHAPFHFDLSIFDLYASVRAGAAVVLVGETLGKDPAALGRFVAQKAISVWYSAPSVLALMLARGSLPPRSAAPRLVLFAGEVFPLGPLKELRRAWPDSALHNLYGPTETNVCTAFPIPDQIPEERTAPFPIGRVCPPFVGRIIDADGQDAAPGAIGELVIAGPGVMKGYFARADLTASAFLIDAQGRAWYRTGDLARDPGDGCLEFHGRRDRMVKKRGHRIELGDIENTLYQYQEVDRAGVVARTDESGISIAAFVALKPSGRKSVIALKRHCTTHLPGYMIPDTITFMDRLPATSTDKVDYQRLQALARDGGTSG